MRWLTPTSPTWVASVASFYTMLRKEPAGHFLVQVCTNLSCSLLGAQTLVDYLKANLNVDVSTMDLTKLLDCETEVTPAHQSVCLTALGAALRAQMGSAELDLGVYTQKHDRGTAALDKVTADVEYGELSYVNMNVITGMFGSASMRSASRSPIVWRVRSKRPGRSTPGSWQRPRLRRRMRRIRSPSFKDTPGA